MSVQQSILVKNVQNTLLQSGYITSRGFKSKSSCFDLAARKERKLFIKCLLNVDNFKEKQKSELKYISAMFTGSPVLIGERNKHKKIEEGVIYEKSGIPTLNFNTFQNIIIHDLLPYIYARRGGYFVKINEMKFEKEREDLQFSLSELAHKVGVSRKTIYSYERGRMDASIKIFRALKQFFQSHIEKPIDIFSWKFTIDKEFLNDLMVELDDLQNYVDEILKDLGLRVFWPEKLPFDAITSEEEPEQESISPPSSELKIITGLSSKNEKLKETYQKIQQVESISQVIPSLRMIITEEKIKLPNIDNIPIIEKKKLENIENKKKLMEKITK